MQEISPYSDSYVVGPASLTAVKSGQSLPYDTNFVIAEVNADILDYCEVEKDKYQLAATDTTRVYSCIIHEGNLGNSNLPITFWQASNALYPKVFML